MTKSDQQIIKGNRQAQALTRQERMQALWADPAFRERMKHRTRKPRGVLEELRLNKAIREERKASKATEKAAKRTIRAERKRRQELSSSHPIPMIKGGAIMPTWAELRTALITVMTVDGPRRVPDHQNEN